MMRWFWDQYLADASRRDDPHASPLRATSLAGLPPAAVSRAGYDPLRDEGVAYAEALRAAGVPVDVRHFEAMVHGYLQMVTVSDGAAAASRAATEALRDALATGAPV